MSTDDPNGDDISRGSPHVFVTRLKLKHGETINGGQLYQTYDLAGLTWFGRSEPSDLTWNLGYPTASRRLSLRNYQLLLMVCQKVPSCSSLA